MDRKEAMKHDLFCLARWAGRYAEKGQQVADHVCNSRTFQLPVSEECVETAMELKEDLKALKSFVGMLILSAGLQDEYNDQLQKWLIEEDRWRKFRRDCDTECDELLNELDGGAK